MGLSVKGVTKKLTAKLRVKAGCNVLMLWWRLNSIMELMSLVKGKRQLSILFSNVSTPLLET
jgi:hypothetical protein